MRNVLYEKLKMRVLVDYTIFKFSLHPHTLINLNIIGNFWHEAIKPFRY